MLTWIVKILLRLPVTLLKIPFRIITKVLLIQTPSWRKFPPGPLANWLPIVGSLPLFAVMPSYLMLTRMAKKFGKIYRLKLGSTTFVVISDTTLVRETFNSEDFCGRRIPPLWDVMDRLGIIQTEGAFMRNQRAFVDKVMLSLAFRNDIIRKIYHERASIASEELIEKLDASNGRPIFIDASLRFTITNIIFATLVGQVFSDEDLELLSLIHYSRESFREMKLISFANFVPYLDRLPHHQLARSIIMARKEAFDNYVRNIVEIHRREMNPLAPKNLIEAFLAKMIEPEAQNQFFTEPQLYAILGELFSTSLETISATIHWILLAILKNPQIQEYIQDDLSGVVSPLSTPSVKQLEEMPYLEATILEGLRFSSILPIGVPHSAVRDATIEGYHIPKDAMIVGLFWKIHRDPELWKNDPNKFNPTNFLNDRGYLKATPNQMTFSAGRRFCLGDHVTITTIYIILANILHKFRIEAENGVELPSLDESLDGVLREPLPFKLRFIYR